MATIFKRLGLSTRPCLEKLIKVYVGSVPGESINTRGIVGTESLKAYAKSNAGGNVYY